MVTASIGLHGLILLSLYLKLKKKLEGKLLYSCKLYPSPPPPSTKSLTMLVCSSLYRHWVEYCVCTYNLLKLSHERKQVNGNRSMLPGWFEFSASLPKRLWRLSEITQSAYKLQRTILMWHLCKWSWTANSAKDAEVWSNNHNCWTDRSNSYQNFKKMKANIFCLDKCLRSHFFPIWEEAWLKPHPTYQKFFSWSPVVVDGHPSFRFSVPSDLSNCHMSRSVVTLFLSCSKLNMSAALFLLTLQTPATLKLLHIADRLFY